MDLENWLKDRPFFFQLIDKSQLIGCEIGVEFGENAYNILTYLDMKDLLLIDPYKEYGGMLGNGVLATKDTVECRDTAFKVLEPFEKNISWILDFSDIASTKIKDESLNFVYIDGNHRFEYVLQDITNYWSKIKKGGIIGGHDFKSGTGVEKAVTTFCDLNDLYFHKEFWDWTIKKDE
jgi:hypothetical protein